MASGPLHEEEPAGQVPAAADPVAAAPAFPGRPSLGRGRSLSPAQVLALQRSAGNAAVARELAGAAAPDVPAATAGGLLVADDATPSPNQMRRSEFLERARPALLDTALGALGGTPWGAYAEPLVADWLARLEAQDAGGLEHMAHGAGLRTEGAGSAAELMELARAKLASALAGDLAALSAGESAAAAGPEGAGLDAAGEESVARSPADPRSALGRGAALPGELGGPLGSAMGRDLGAVRVHTDAAAGQAARSLGARAFTVGEDIAFAPGEFQPQTLVGQALIAHEVAHVVQQDGAGQEPLAKGAPGDAALEQDADLAAVGALAGLIPALRGLARTAMPRLRTGLRLQACNGGTAPAPPAPAAPAPAPPVRPPDQHAGLAVPGAAVQLTVLQLLNPHFQPAPPVPVPVGPGPGPGPAPAPPVIAVWDGAAGQPHEARNRAKLKQDLTWALNVRLRNEMGGVRATAAQPRLPATDFEGPGNAAKGVVDAAFGNWTATAAMTPSQATARHGFTFRASGPGQTLFDAYDPAARAAAGAAISHEDLALWAAQHDANAGRVLNRHNFDPGQQGSDMERFFFDEIVEPWAPAGSTKRRDLELWDQFGFALTAGTRDRVSMFTKVNQVPGGPPNAAGVNPESERATRWDGFKTLAHEYIHTLEHPTFTVARVAGPSVMNEGFCEMFTKEVLDAIIPLAPGNAALRTQVEGGAFPPPAPPILAATYASPGPYVPDRNAALAIKAQVGDQGVKAAYFQGHVEYLGIDPAGAPLAAVPAAADEVAIPAGIADVAALATASGVPDADVRANNPAIGAPLPARAHLPGCREHVVVETTDAGGTSVRESKAQIAQQNGVLEAELDRANPGRNWAGLAAGDHILIPRH